jgi:hypothetical protein
MFFFIMGFPIPGWMGLVGGVVGVLFGASNLSRAQLPPEQQAPPSMPLHYVVWVPLVILLLAMVGVTVWVLTAG